MYWYINCGPWSFRLHKDKYPTLESAYFLTLGVALRYYAEHIEEISIQQD